MERREKETFRSSRKVVGLPVLTKKVVAGKGFKESGLRCGDRRKEVVKGRKLFCRLAVKEMGYSGTAAARDLRVTTSAVNRLAVSEELPDLKKYLKLFYNLP